MINNKEAQRNDYLDCLKGLAAFFVVLHHLLAYYKGYGWLFMVVRYLHMPVFFFVSGYFSYHSIHKRNAKEYISGRIKRLLIPYVMWTFIAVLAKLIFSFKEINALDLFMQSLWNGTSVWFLIVLFISNMFMFISSRLIDKGIRVPIFISIIIMILIPWKIELLSYYRLQELLIFYLFGYYFRKHKCDKILSNSLSNFGSKKYCLIVLFLLLFLLPFIYDVAKENWCFYIMTQIVGNSIGLIIVSLLGYYLFQILGRYCAILGKYSLEIYCIHMLFISYITLDIPQIINNSIYLLDCFLVLYSICICLICVILSKYILSKIYLFQVLMLGKANETGKL